MKIRADRPIDALPKGPEQTLAKLRKLRGFVPQKWIQAKVYAIDSYLSRNKLSSAVLGVSGGVDSAVAAALLARVAQIPDSSLKKICLLSLPSYNDPGVSGQESSNARARDVARTLDLDLTTLDLSGPMELIRQGLGQGLGTEAAPWAAGQGVAVARTTACYQAVALLSQQGLPGLVVGTINRDEGAYLGYVGKASDGMVDLQVLSDLHKSEVYAVAKELGVPNSVLDATPTGDMFDACPDTAVFGAPYEAVELLILARTLLNERDWEKEKNGWEVHERQLWELMEENLEKLHSYNRHKYTVGSPAIHLDVLPSGIDGGWAGPAEVQPYTGSVVPSMAAVRTLGAGDRADWIKPGWQLQSQDLELDHGTARLFERVLTNEGVETLNSELSQGKWKAADLRGNWRDGIEMSRPIALDGVGSWRTTFIDQALARTLWESLCHHIPAFRMSEELSRFDASGFPVWRPIGISSVFRAIRYMKNGVLVPHYDAPFKYEGKQRTAMSVVIYLDQAEGGQLRFIRDPLASTTYSQCDFQDWNRPAEEDEVLLEVPTRAGSVVIFDHRMLHDSAVILQGQKTLLRTDVIFEGVG